MYQDTWYGADKGTTGWWSTNDRASGNVPFGVAGVGTPSDVFDGKHGMMSDATDRGACDVRYMLVAYEATAAMTSDHSAEVTFSQGAWFPFSTGATFIKLSAVAVAGILSVM